MKTSILLSVGVSICLLTSCVGKVQKLTVPEPKPFSEHAVFPIDELVNPGMMAFCHDKLVLVNMPRGKKDLLYFYEPSDMSLCFSTLKLGKGNQEVVDMNPAFFRETADGFLLNTRNWMGIASFKMDEAGIEKLDEFAVATEPMNHLLMMDDGTFIYKEMHSDRPFTSQVRGGDPVPFGEFPKAFISNGGASDLFNMFEYSLASSSDGNMMAFFQFVPKMRIYRGTRLLSECEYEAIPQKVSSLDNFYEGANTSIYFLSPQSIGNHVYVVFVNKTMEQLEENMSMQLLQMDEKGAVLSSWTIEDMFPVFSVSPDEQYFYAYKETDEAGEIHRFKLN